MKTDIGLGARVAEMLEKKGVQTPGSHINDDSWLNTKENEEKISKNFKQIMEVLRLDLDDDSLKETPRRVAKAFLNEMFRGLDIANFPKITMIDNKMGYDEMLVEKEISVKSHCEHHFVAIDGKATVGYIPKNKVIGLSKINRVVDYFSRRPQVQERLTEQIHATLCYLLDTQNVAVVIDAVHFCVKHRGIEDINSHTVTSKLSGAFKGQAATRQEFMNLARS